MNGYPDRFIEIYGKPPRKRDELIGPKCKPVFIRVPFQGDSRSHEVRHRIFSSVKKAYPVAEPIVLSTTKTIPVRSLKDGLRSTDRSHVIYKFICGCGVSYVGRRARRLSLRIAEHLPKWAMKDTYQLRLAW